MSVIYIALPVALLLALVAALAFAISVRSGQMDDLETPPLRMLYDDVESPPGSSTSESSSSVKS